MTPAESDLGFAEWCERMAVGRLRRRLAAGLPLSPIGWRTLQRFGFGQRPATTASFSPAVNSWLAFLADMLAAEILSADSKGSAA
jgi:hypothetical protein